MLIGWLEERPADFQAKWTCPFRKKMIVHIDLDWTPGQPFRASCSSLKKGQHRLKMTNDIYKAMIISFSAGNSVKTRGVEN